MKLAAISMALVVAGYSQGLDPTALLKPAKWPVRARSGHLIWGECQGSGANPYRVVADTDEPTPPCGACRQILWEFGGDLEVILGNLGGEKARYQLKDLLPHPFDARLLS